MAKVLTLKQLEEAGACDKYYKRFQELFGESVEVTYEVCLKHSKDFNFGWALNRLLDKDARDMAFITYSRDIAERNSNWDILQEKYHNNQISLTDLQTGIENINIQWQRNLATLFCREYNS